MSITEKKVAVVEPENKVFDIDVGTIEAVTTLSDTDIEKLWAKIHDEAGNVVIEALTARPVDIEKTKQVLRKIDNHILPLLCITYGLQFLDKTTLGYSSVFGIIPDNHLVGQDYSWATSIFYFGYLFAEYPGVLLMQRFPIAKFLAINIIAWSGIIMLTSACSSFAGLATVRFFLGVFEATISPGFVAVTGIWWTRQEQVTRSAYWVMFLGVFATIGGLLTFGIGHINGSLSQWKYIYLILGAITFLWGFLFLWVVPDNPATARWLSEEEKVIAIHRLIENKTGTKTREFVKSQAVEAFRDPFIWLLFLMSIVNALGSAGLSFGSIIITGFGFTPIQTTLMNIPMGVFQVMWNLLGTWASAKLPNSKLHVATAAMVPAIIGTILVNNLDTTNQWGRMIGVWLLPSYPTAFLVVVGLLGTNVAGTTKRTVANGLVFVGYCVGQISGPQFFKNSEKPAYPSGIKGMLCSFIFNLILAQILRFLYVRENRRRNKMIEGKSEDELARLREESNLMGFENVTDGQNAMFRYTL